LFSEVSLYAAVTRYEEFCDIYDRQPAVQARSSQAGNGGYFPKERSLPELQISAFQKVLVPKRVDDKNQISNNP
jgi:hypothetical protein